MKSSLGKIFGLKKVTFDAPSDSFEQDTLFIEVGDVRGHVSEGRATAKVSGSLTVFSKKDALPYGFFNKKITNAHADLTKQFIFSNEVDVASSPARAIDIGERRMQFLYLYSAQHDPNQGELTSLELEEVNG